MPFTRHRYKRVKIQKIFIIHPDYFGWTNTVNMIDSQYITLQRLRGFEKKAAKILFTRFRDHFEWFMGKDKYRSYARTDGNENIFINKIKTSKKFSN